MPDEDAPQTENLGDIAFVKRVTIGNLDRPVREKEVEAQVALLNRCLQSIPRGKIIGKDVSTLLYQSGKTQLTVQQTTYHIGFPRKPLWVARDETSSEETAPE